MEDGTVTIITACTADGTSVGIVVGFIVIGVIGADKPPARPGNSS
ncbi:hypothetical protein [Methylovirgula sp. 4M-Z18]|nr:hypothetical protein [Methylovirgula sp. 4M-Z18]